MKYPLSTRQLKQYENEIAAVRRKIKREFALAPECCAIDSTLNREIISQLAHSGLSSEDQQAISGCLVACKPFNEDTKQALIAITNDIMLCDDKRRRTQDRYNAALPSSQQRNATDILYSFVLSDDAKSQIANAIQYKGMLNSGYARLLLIDQVKATENMPIEEKERLLNAIEPISEKINAFHLSEVAEAWLKSTLELCSQNRTGIIAMEGVIDTFMLGQDEDGRKWQTKCNRYDDDIKAQLNETAREIMRQYADAAVLQKQCKTIGSLTSEQKKLFDALNNNILRKCICRIKNITHGSDNVPVFDISEALSFSGSMIAGITHNTRRVIGQEFTVKPMLGNNLTMDDATKTGLIHDEQGKNTSYLKARYRMSSPNNQISR